MEIIDIFESDLHVVRLSVADFSIAMEQMLQAKDNELGSQGWLNPEQDVKFLFDGLKKEIRSLEAAMNDCDGNKIKKETVDIANWAMMIFDRISKQN